MRSIRLGTGYRFVSMIGLVYLFNILTLNYGRSRGEVFSFDGMLCM